MERYLQKFLDFVVEFCGKFVLAALILLIGFKVVSFALKKLKKSKGFNKLEKTSQTFIISILNVIFRSIVSIIAVTTLGIPVASVVAILGSAGLAIGLALQGGLSNIAGGVMIMIFKPFKVGDYIDTHTDSGTVREINLFHTVIDTIDGKVVVMPNGNLSNSVVVNYNGLKKRIVDLKLSVNYNSDIDKVKKVLEDVYKNNEYTLKEEEPLIALSEHADSALIFTFRAPVNTEDYWKARFSLLEEIKKTFDKEKISIPYPQLDVHFDK